MVGFLNGLRLFTRHFTPSWLVITMGTGSVATTLSLFPFAFPGQQGIALAVWCLDCLLLALFIALLAARLLCFPASVRELMEHPNQSLFFGTLPISISAITGGIVHLLVPRFGASALAAAYTLSWINLPIVAVIALLVPIYMCSVHDHRLEAMTALWLVPLIPGTTAAAVTGNLAKTHLHHAQSVLLLYLGVCMLAVGFTLSYHVLTIYYQRLICHNLPPRELIVSSFIPVGAVGMAGWALLNLATAADLHVRSYIEKLPGAHPDHDAAWLDVALPTGMAAAGVLGLCLWAYAGWWLLLAICSVAQTVRRGIPFSLAWWGAVFPIGTFAGTALALGQLFRAQPFKVLGAAICCCQVAVWLFVSAMTIHKGLTGELFHPPCLAPPPCNKDLPAAATQLERQLSQVPGDGRSALGELHAEAFAAVMQPHFAAARASGWQLESASGGAPAGAAFAGAVDSFCSPHWPCAHSKTWSEPPATPKALAAADHHWRPHRSASCHTVVVQPLYGIRVG